jgi:hypothetical protein
VTAEAARGKTLFRDGHHRMNDRVVGLCTQRKLGRSAWD